MKDWFFLNGIDVCRDYTAIGMGIKNPFFILPHLAYAKIAITNNAIMGAEKTGNFFISELLIKESFF